MPCQYCQRSIATDGRDIHYCIERKKVGRKTISIRHEYVAHYDGRYMGDHPHYLAAETALDEYVFDLLEQGLVDDVPTDAPGDDCPDHGPYADDDCPKCQTRTLLLSV